MATDPTKTNTGTPDNVPITKNPAIVAAFASAKAKKQAPNLTPQQKAASNTAEWDKTVAKTPFTQREKDNFASMKESNDNLNKTTDKGIAFPSAAPGEGSSSMNQKWDQHELDVKDKSKRNDEFRKQQEVIDTHIAAKAAGRGYDPKVISHLDTTEGFETTNARRAQMGLPPVNYPNPFKQELKPKTKLQAAMDNLKNPRKSFWDSAQETAQK